MRIITSIAVALFVSTTASFAQTTAKPATTTQKPAAAAPARPATTPAPTAKPAAPRATTTKPAQTAKPVEAPKPKFGNTDVIKLTQAEFTEQQIADAINAAGDKQFDTSADALIALKAAGVTKPIIDMVLGKPYTPEPIASVAAPPNVRIVEPQVVTSQSTAAGAGEQPKENRGNPVGRIFGGIGRSVGVVKDDEPEQGVAATTETSKPEKLRNGEPAVIQTFLAPQEALARVRAFLDNQNFRTEITSNTVKTDWSGETKCPGFTAAKCKERVDVRVENSANGALLRVWVSESRANRTSNKWSDGEIKGERTAKTGAEIEAHLTSAS